MSEDSATIDALLFYLEEPHFYEYLVVDNFRRPLGVDWPHDSLNILERREAILGRINPGFHAFLDLSLFASLLLRETKPQPPADLISRFKSLDGLLENPSIAALFSWSWQPVAVPIVGDTGRGELIYFLVAAVEQQEHLATFPHWCERQLSPESRQAIRDAFAAARRCSGDASLKFFTFPLTNPHEDKELISGRSLGLPLALAALCAASSVRSDLHWLATGDLDADGRVQAVNPATLGAKAALTGKKHALFIYPAANPAPSGAKYCDLKAVVSLEQAWLWADCFAPGRANDIRALELASDNARSFVDNCTALSFAALEHCLRNPHFSSKIRQIFASAELLGSFLRKIENILTSEPDKAARLLALMQSEEDLLQVAATSERLAFVWCSCRLALANHRGDNADSAHWQEQAQKFRAGAERTNPQEFTRFINRFYVASLHNRYVFSPEPPKEFLDILHEEESYHRGGVNYTLGALYGTLAQNYGFCGPAYFGELEKYVAKSQQAFGEGQCPEHHADYRRGFAYLFAGHMDRNDKDSARKALWNYLGADCWQSFGSALDSHAGSDRTFAEAMLARYLGHTFNPAAPEPDIQEFVDRTLAADKIINNFQEHPRQLWAYNSGCLALRCDRKALAAALWQRSLDLCDPLLNDKAGETMHAMSLLPLAALAKSGLLTDGQKGRAKTIIDAIRVSKHLNRKHFAMVTYVDDANEALIVVGDHLAKLFPFSYR
ncbi:hypothetical protein [Geoalkalibacter halelectricus]|uniref:hypothetical protein n=1 Tax=Geoalkalibacter halelectricus TaxID=2847045 RepID=UPI003D1A28B7